MLNDNDLSSAEILHKEFSVAFMGYNKNQVEDYLEKVAKYIDILQERLNSSEDKKRESGLEPSKETIQSREETKSKEDLISRTLIIAEQTKEDIFKNAQKEAENIVKESELKSKKMISDAKHYLSVLEHQISLLEERKRIFSTRFRSELQALLENIKSDDINQNVENRKQDDENE